MKKRAMFWAVMSMLTQAVHAQNGELDPSFGVNGIVEYAFGQSFSESICDVLIQPDGKIVVAGTKFVDDNDFMILRFLSDGSPDVSFGDAGVAIHDASGYSDFARAMVLLDDGDLLIAGYVEAPGQNAMELFRINSDGSVDPDFGDNGMIQIFISDYDAFGNDVMLQDDGKIVFAGHGNVDNAGEDFVVVRLLQDGTFDSSFGIDGIVSNVNDVSGGTQASCAMQEDGKIVIAGMGGVQGSQHFCVMRLNEDGTLDNAFSDDGIQLTGVSGFYNWPSRVLVQQDGSILTAGYAGNLQMEHFAMVRYTTTGNLDATFGSNGTFIHSINTKLDIINDFVIQNDGKILSCGYTTQDDNNWDFIVFRQGPNGAIDGGFGVDGVVNTPCSQIDVRAEALALQTDGKCVVAGYSQGVSRQLVLARYGVSAVSVNESDEAEGHLKLYPNPCDDKLFVAFNEDTQSAHIEIFNQLGAAVLKTVMYRTNPSLDMSNLADGLYSVVLNVDGHLSVVSVLKK